MANGVEADGAIVSYGDIKLVPCDPPPPRRLSHQQVARGSPQDVLRATRARKGFRRVLRAERRRGVRQLGVLGRVVELKDEHRARRVAPCDTAVQRVRVEDEAAALRAAHVLNFIIPRDPVIIKAALAHVVVGPVQRPVRAARHLRRPRPFPYVVQEQKRLEPCTTSVMMPLARAVLRPVWKSTRRAMRNRHRHAIEQAER